MERPLPGAAVKGIHLKKIVIVTGASSGMGRGFAETAADHVEFDEMWIIARRQERLEEVKNSLKVPVRCIPMDLTDRASYKTLENMLAEEKPDIVRLFNCSGFGKFAATLDDTIDTNLNMMDLNCGAAMAMTQIALPYMHEGARILNIASVAAFQPIPYINVYAATKAFLLYYSRALNRELKSRKITVTALCPFWTKTEFFDRAIAADRNKVVKKYAAMYDPKDLVARGWRDMERGKDVSGYGFIARAQALLCKILPHSLVMNVWMAQQSLK